MHKIIDLTGQRFGRLIALKCIGKNKFRYRLWECECDCGNIAIVTSYNLMHSRTISCGCYRIENTKKQSTKHNLRHTDLYVLFGGMKHRCYDKNAVNYKNYGGRGITICNEWLNNFKAFYDWSMLNGYKKGLTIDRIDNNGNYEPSNCRWVTREVQNNNKRTCNYLTYNGETHTIKEWSVIKGLDYRCLQQRITVLKWDIEKALNKPNKKDYI